MAIQLLSTNSITKLQLIPLLLLIHLIISLSLVYCDSIPPPPLLHQHQSINQQQHYSHQGQQYHQPNPLESTHSLLYKDQQQQKQHHNQEHLVDSQLTPNSNYAHNIIYKHDDASLRQQQNIISETQQVYHYTNVGDQQQSNDVDYSNDNNDNVRWYYHQQHQHQQEQQNNNNLRQPQQFIYSETKQNELLDSHINQHQRHESQPHNNFNHHQQQQFNQYQPPQTPQEHNNHQYRDKEESRRHWVQTHQNHHQHHAQQPQQQQYYSGDNQQNRVHDSIKTTQNGHYEVPNAENPFSHANTINQDYNNNQNQKLSHNHHAKYDNSFLNAQNQQAQAQLPDCQRIAAAAAASFAKAKSHDTTNQEDTYGSIQNKNFLLVATLNGLIYAIDLKLDGQIKWTKKVGNLFSSTVGAFGYNSVNGGSVKLIPSLDGKLYFHKSATNTLESLPLDADSLLKNSHRFGDDFFLSGGRKHHIYGIDPATGMSIYTCGLDGCEYPKNEKNIHEHVLVLEHTNRIVRAIHPKTGSEQWNIDVSQLRMRLVKNLEECRSLHERPVEEASPMNDQANSYVLPQIEWDIQKGYISSKDHQWFHQFNAPITNIWTLDDGFLAQLELFNPTPLNDHYQIHLPQVHIGSHNNQLYVQMSPYLNNLHDQYSHSIQCSSEYYNIMSEIEYYEHGLAYVNQDGASNSDIPQIEWHHEPGLSENDIVEFYEQGLDHPTLLNNKYEKKPHDKLRKESCEKPSLLKSPEDETCRSTPPGGNPSNSSPNYSMLSRGIHINEDGTIAYQHNYDNSFPGMFNAVSYYWREFASLCLLTALILNWLFLIVKRRLINPSDNIRPRRQTLSKKNPSERRKRSASISTVDDCQDHHKEEHGALTDTSKTNNIDSNINLKHRTSRAYTLSDPCVNNSNWSTPPNSLSSSLNTSSMFKSRYSSDFDSIRRLGRGGFGVVFEAKNQIDDCHYAVKRICLPLEKDARERVMREVKALAKLDHSGIVRYYNAWLESPPEEWLKEHDKQFGISSNKDNLKTSLPSTYDTENDKLGLSVRDFSASAKFRKDLGDTSSSDLMIGNSTRRKVNGFKKRLLKSNSNSLSLDVVFEGSGSIRLETESNDGDKSSKKSSHHPSTPSRPIPINNYLNSRQQEIPDESNDSDSDDDILHFSTRQRPSNHKFNPEESSFSYDLSEPFSSSGDTNPSDKPGNDINGVKTNGVSAKIPENNNRNQFHNMLTADNMHTEKAYLYIQMQLCRKDTLKDWLLTNCDKRDKTVIFDLFYQIVDAVEYVHSQDLIHRDLKPSNIFFSMDGIVKIGDFGLVTAKSTGIGSSLDLHESVAECDAERCIDAVHTEQVGTQLYMSPEQINGVNYNHKVDIFAMGLILLELLIPFRTQMQRINVLVKARNQFFSEEFRKNFSQEHELLKSLLCRNPQKRLSAAELKQHNLLTNCQLSPPVIERLYQRRRTISSNSSTE